MGEDEQKVSAPGAIPLGSHVFGVRYDRTGTVEGSHTPLGDVSLYVDGDVVATRSGVRTHPGSFGLAGGGIAVGRNCRPGGLEQRTRRRTRSPAAPSLRW